jgi:hypothetical protein
MILPELDIATLNTNQEGGIYGTRLLLEHGQQESRRRTNCLLQRDKISCCRRRGSKNITGCTSGKLCAGNIFCISNEVIRDQLREEETEKKQKHSDKEQRKVVAMTKHNKKFCLAGIKYFNGTHLLCDDLKSLLKEITVHGDSPLKEKVDDLRSQLQRRKTRMEKYNLFGNATTDGDTKVSTTATTTVNDNNPLTELNNIMVVMMEDDNASAAEQEATTMEVDKTNPSLFFNDVVDTKCTGVMLRVDPPFNVDSDSDADTDSPFFASLTLLASASADQKQEREDLANLKDDVDDDDVIMTGTVNTTSTGV